MSLVVITPLSELFDSLFIIETVFPSTGMKNTQKMNNSGAWTIWSEQEVITLPLLVRNHPSGLFYTCVGEIGNHAGLSSRYYEFKSRTQGF